MDTTAFLTLLRTAADAVPRDYLGLDSARTELERHYGAQQGTDAYKELREIIEKRDERVFCYELYHQMRTRMPPTAGATDGLPALALQGEVRKTLIGPYLSARTGANALKKEYIPDLLLHRPGTFENQFAAVEVKTTPRLSWPHIRGDLDKLVEFVTSYQYEMGVFFCVNVPVTRVRRSLTSVPAAAWMQLNAEHLPSLHVIAKPSYGLPAVFIPLVRPAPRGAGRARL